MIVQSYLSSKSPLWIPFYQSQISSFMIKAEKVSTFLIMYAKNYFYYLKNRKK